MIWWYDMIDSFWNKKVFVHFKVRHCYFLYIYIFMFPWLLLLISRIKMDMLYWAYPRLLHVIWISIRQDNDDIGHITAIASRWNQHLSANIFKCSGRAGTAFISGKRWNRFLNLSERLMSVQVKIFVEVDFCRVGDKSHSSAAAVNVQSGDKKQQKCLYQFEVVEVDTSRFIQHKNDIFRTLNRRTCNIMICKFLDM